MKNRKLILSFLMCLSSTILIIFASSAIAGAAENIDVGQLKIYDLNASNLSSVPEGIYAATSKTVNAECNTSVTYNNTLNSFDFTKTSKNIGELYIGKLYPMTDGDIAIDLGINASSSWSVLYISSSVSYLTVRRTSNNDYKITSTWEDDNGSLVQTQTFTIPASAVKNNHVKIHTTSYNANRTNVVWYNDTLCTSSPYYKKSVRDITYPVMINPLLYVTAYIDKDADPGDLTVHIYSVEQTIPQKTVTVYPANNEMGFGLDDPLPQYTQNGTAYMLANGQVGTVWCNPTENDPANVAYIKSLLDNGWELGIHFKTSLDSYSLEDSYTVIDNEVAAVTATYGQVPTSWCSLRNRDNVSHALYC
ncbi:MAG: hypothetical protein EHJ95_06510, partial [Methanobacteriota archaeon]